MATILLIKTGDSFPEVIEQYGDFEDLFRARLGPYQHALEVFDARSQGSLPNPDDYQGVLISGSHAMVTSAEGWSERLLPCIRAMHERSTPLLGVCYGHQLLARALGGVADDHPRGPEVGTVEVELTGAGHEDMLFGGLPSRFAAHVTHTQSALQLPPGAVVLAANDYEPHQAFRLGSCTWGVQFHPEFSAAVTRIYIERQRQRLEALGRAPQQLLAEVRETAVCNSLLQRFVGLLND